MGGTLETGDLYNSDRTSPCCSCLSRSIQVDCGYAWFEFRLAEARARRAWGREEMTLIELKVAGSAQVASDPNVQVARLQSSSLGPAYTLYHLLEESLLN